MLCYSLVYNLLHTTILLLRLLQSSVSLLIKTNVCFSMPSSVAKAAMNILMHSHFLPLACHSSSKVTPPVDQIKLEWWTRNEWLDRFYPRPARTTLAPMSAKCASLRHFCNSAPLHCPACNSTVHLASRCGQWSLWTVQYVVTELETCSPPRASSVPGKRQPRPRPTG